MTIILELSDELVEKLEEQAYAQGCVPNEYVRLCLERCLKSLQDNAGDAGGGTPETIHDILMQQEVVWAMPRRGLQRAGEQGDARPT